MLTYHQFLQSKCNLIQCHKAYRRELVCVCQNGMLIRCPGMFSGELIMMALPDSKHLVFAMMASNPNFEFITSAFHELIYQYSQCIQRRNESIVFSPLTFIMIVGVRSTSYVQHASNKVTWWSLEECLLVKLELFHQMKKYFSVHYI
jgi:hypothetical protein